MIGTEIIIDTGVLLGAISNMRLLQTGTVYGKMNANMFMLSCSETSDAAVEMYQALQATEAVLLELVEKTIQAMTEAGISFLAADRMAAENIRSIDGMLII